MKQRIWIPQLIAILMLAKGISSSNPYGYYILLRIICCAACAYLCVQAVVLKDKYWTWMLGVTAFIYNPIFPVKMVRDSWTVVNILTIIVLGISVGILKRKAPSKRGE